MDFLFFQMFNLIIQFTDKLYSLIEALKEEYIFAPGSDDNLLFPVANFYECLMDTSHKLPIGNYGLFKVVEDYGIMVPRI